MFRASSPPRWNGVVLIGLLLSLIAIHLPVHGAETAFTIAVIPDTQKYVRYDLPSRWPVFDQQTQWIVDHVASDNIVFVSHEGDLVENGGAQPNEWERADAAMDRLDGVVPYATVAGNHDYERNGSRSSGTATYLSYFGPQRYSGYSWYGGATSNGLNSYQTFQAGSWTFLHLALELEVPDEAIAWAQGVINNHPGLPTIVTTHAYQRDDLGRTTTSQYQANSGEQIWQKLIKINPQIFMVLNGHFSEADGEWHQISQNDAGQDVFEMVADYQDHPNGGDGYMRLLHFDPAANQIQVRTYSPKLNMSLTDEDSQFTLPVNFAQRFGIPSQTPPTSTATAVPTDTVTPTSLLVEAEDYRAGGPNVGYFDTTAGNSGRAYRTDDVDIGPCTDGSPCYFVGWVAPDEWLAYDINIASAGTYRFTLRVATPYTGKRVWVEVDGVNVTGSLTLPDTGGWQTWRDVTTAPTALTAGSHVLRVVAETGAFNLNNMTISSDSLAATATPLPATDTPTVIPPTAMATIVWPTAIETAIPSAIPTAVPVGPLRFNAVADARVEERYPNTNLGTSRSFKVDGGRDPAIETYLRFTVSGVSGPIQKAKLRIYTNTSTSNGPAVYGASDAWDERTITWNNRPTRSSHALDDKAALRSDGWIEYDVTSLIKGNGSYTFAFATNSTDGLTFASRESTTPPQLVVTTN